MYTTVFSELDGLLEAVQEELANTGQEGEVENHSKWQERLVHTEETWTEMRSTIMEAKLCQAYLPDVVCFTVWLGTIYTLRAIYSFICSLSLCIMQLCSKCKQNDAILRCSECGPHHLLCVECDRDIHWMYPLHDREIWKDGFFQFVPPHITLDVESMTLVEQGTLLCTF